MNNHQAAELYIRKYREELMCKMPFYGEILSHLTIVDDNRVETVCTNGKSIHYNSDYIMGKTPNERNYILTHELLHIILLHCIRGIGKNQEMWNIATDYVVNGILDKMIRTMSSRVIPMSRPSKGTFYELYSEQSADELYSQIVNDNKDNKKIIKIIILRKRYGDASSDKYTVKTKTLSLDLDMDMTEEEVKNLEKELQSIIDSASKNWSSDSTATLVGRELGALKQSRRLPWKRLLKRFLEEENYEDSSYDTPERKYLHMDMILPGTNISGEDRLNDVWAFIDCSGSIEADEMQAFREELYTICKGFNATVNIAYWDTEIRDLYEGVNADNLSECIPHYSGGTEPTCIYMFLRENHIDPKVLIILSDGGFDRIDDYYCKRNRNKTIFVLTEGSTSDYSYIGKVARL